jgi:hypothetical protein
LSPRRPAGAGKREVRRDFKNQCYHYFETANNYESVHFPGQ